MKSLLALSFLSLTLVSCAHHQEPTSAAKAATTEKNNYVTDADLIAPQTEKALGEALLTETLRKQKMLEVSDEFKTYTADITKKLGENSSRPSLQYEVYFIDSKDFIALGFPGGKILISKGFLNIIKTESEYANVIANQMAHIAKQHLLQYLLKDSDYTAELKSGTLHERIVAQSLFLINDLGFDVPMVNEADRLAPTYAMHLGYDIHGLLNVLQNVGASMVKTHSYGKSDLSYNLINHRMSMNGVFVAALEKIDKSGFPKAEDRFAANFKKIKPIKKKK